MRRRPPPRRERRRPRRSRRRVKILTRGACSRVRTLVCLGRWTFRQRRSGRWWVCEGADGFTTVGTSQPLYPPIRLRSLRCCRDAHCLPFILITHIFAQNSREAQKKGGARGSERRGDENERSGANGAARFGGGCHGAAPATCASEDRRAFKWRCCSAMLEERPAAAAAGTEEALGGGAKRVGGRTPGEREHRGSRRRGAGGPHARCHFGIWQHVQCRMGHLQCCSAACSGSPRGR